MSNSNVEEHEKMVRESEAQVASGFHNAQMDEQRQKDIQAINERKGINESYGNKAEEDHGKKIGKKKSSLGDDDEGLDDNKEDKDSEETSENNSESSSEDKKEDSKGKGKEKTDGFFKSKFQSIIRKYKAYLIFFGILLAVFLVVFFMSVFSSAYESFTNAISSFFGIPEVDTDDIKGLYTDESYYLDENGNEISHEQLISNLMNDDNCSKVTGWTKIGDWFSGDDFNGDACKFLRYIKSQAEVIKNDTGAEVDEALIISTIFYGYDSKPSPDLYKDRSQVEEGDVESSEHYLSLKEVLSDKGFINKTKLKEIMDYSVSKKTQYYYVWVIEEEKNDDGVVTKKTGKCKKIENTNNEYNLNKWKVYMRFGKEAADLFDDVVLKSKSYSESDDECKGDISNSDLLEQVKSSLNSDGTSPSSSVSCTIDISSIEEARADLKDVNENSSDAFYQYADYNTKTKDVFKNYKNVEFDYRNGFAYIAFPGFKDAIEDSNINVSYDEVFTPKEIEIVIDEIISKKQEMNDVLLRKDPDTPDDISNYSTRGGVVIGSYCNDYLTSPFDQIKVELTDCYGTYLDTVSFEDYIIGVANGEVSNTNDDYVLSQMLAAISFALSRRDNYSKGNEIVMKSGTCDQAYCSLMRGCTSKRTPVGECNTCDSFYIGGDKAESSLYPKYQELYQIASQYLIISNNKVHEALYNSTIQNEWERKASLGMSFTQIIQETYESKGASVVKCSDLNTTVTNEDLPEEEENKVGNTASEEYPLVSDNMGPFYGFSYKASDDGSISINPDWKNENLTTISPECSDSRFSSMSFTVHKKAVTNYKKAFDGVCKMLTEGVTLSDGSTCTYSADDLMDGTVFVEKRSSLGIFNLHAYGLAQDWNYSKKFTIDNKEYMPYNTRVLADYLEFIDAIGGKEESCQNINYILWLKAYKDAGFQWGGNYGRNGLSGSFDGKLFELVYK